MTRFAVTNIQNANMMKYQMDNFELSLKLHSLTSEKERKNKANDINIPSNDTINRPRNV